MIKNIIENIQDIIEKLIHIRIHIPMEKIEGKEVAIKK